MAVTVNARGKLVPSSEKPKAKFGSTDIKDVQISVKMRCVQDPNDKRRCQCNLTAIDLLVLCRVRLNRSAIQKNYFDVVKRKPKKGRKGKKETIDEGKLLPPKGCDKAKDFYKLDDLNVLVHECSHCDDLVDKARELIQAEVERVEAIRDKVKNPIIDPMLTQICTRTDAETCAEFENRKNCESAFQKIYQKRLKELAKGTFNKIASHGRKKTEKKARKIQAEDLKLRRKACESIQLGGKLNPLTLDEKLEKKVRNLKSAAQAELEKKAKEEPPKK